MFSFFLPSALQAGLGASNAQLDMVIDAKSYDSVQLTETDLKPDEQEYEAHVALLQSCIETLQQSRSDQEFRDRELLCARFDCSGSVILTPVVCSEGANQLGIASGEVVRMYHGTSKVAAEQIQAEGFKPSTHGRFMAQLNRFRDSLASRLSRQPTITSMWRNTPKPIS